MLTKLTGVLRNLADVEYEFETDEGEVYPIPPHIAEGVQYNYRIWLDLMTGEWGRLEESYKSPNKETKRVLLLRTCRVGTPEDQKVKLYDETARLAQEAELFYRHYCGDIWNVMIVSDIVEYEQAPWNNNWNAKLFNDYMNEQGYTYGFFQYFHCWSHYGHGSYCGLGQVYGKYSWTQASCGLHTIIHELGHNFGLHHSNEGTKEYGDKTCVMGAGGTNIPGINAPHLVKLRKEARRPYASVTESTGVTLIPMETNDHCILPGESVVAEVQGSQRVYLSRRKHEGAVYDFNLPDEKRVFVHTRESDGKAVLHDTLREGDTKRLPNGFSCSYVKCDGDRSYLWLTNDGTPATGNWPTYPEFPPAGDMMEPWMDGLWIVPKMPGHGLSILNGKTYLFSFKPGEVGYPSFTPMWTPLLTWEQSFKFFDRNNALLLMNLGPTGRDALEITRLTVPPTGSRSGRYVAAPFVIVVHEGIINESGPIKQVALLGHESGENWYYAEGEVGNPTMKVYANRQGRWMQKYLARKLEQVGYFTWNSDGTFTFDINGVEYYG